MTSNNDPPEILIALGANIPSRVGPPAETLKTALATLGEKGVAILKVSSFIETPAWPDPTDPPFTNAVASLQTALQPLALLELLHAIETAYGRVRSRPNAPRTLDLDLLAHGGAVLAGARLTLPHPRLAERRFVLQPLAEVAPDWRHPVTGLTARQMLAALPA
jgi:2-amino-4-hydroxy-6-hydroxymethyldihydropteridine diphosphokinase